jgi:hypothetical protein
VDESNTKLPKGTELFNEISGLGGAALSTLVAVLVDAWATVNGSHGLVEPV